MSHVVEERCCSLCRKGRSGRAQRAQHDRGFIAQVCSRRSCAEIKHLLRKASRISSNASSLVVEVHYYHHHSRPNEDRLDRTYIYSSKLYAESLPKDRAVLPIHLALRDRGRLSTVRKEHFFSKRSLERLRMLRSSAFTNLIRLNNLIKHGIVVTFRSL
jgi:hypothetical protein